MKKIHAVTIGLACLTAALATPLHAAAPKFADLPEVAFPETFGTMPKIPAKSTWEGMYVAATDPDSRSFGADGYRRVGFLVDKDDAASFAKEQLDTWSVPGKDEFAAGASTVCFDVVEPWVLENKKGEWPRNLQRWPNIYTAVASSKAAKNIGAEQMKPHGLRIERLVLDDETATLRVREGWVDPKTLGTVGGDDFQVKFKEVATGPQGIRVFAARDKKRGRLEFAIYRPRPKGAQLRGVLGGNMHLSSGHSSSSSDCGHARVSLKVMPGTGDYASAQIDVISQDRIVEIPKVKSSKASPGSFFAAKDGKFREITVRPLIVHMGVSQGPDDEVPTPTVTFGWRNAGRKHQIAPDAE